MVTRRQPCVCVCVWTWGLCLCSSFAAEWKPDSFKWRWISCSSSGCDAFTDILHAGPRQTDVDTHTDSGSRCFHATNIPTLRMDNMLVESKLACERWGELSTQEVIPFDRRNGSWELQYFTRIEGMRLQRTGLLFFWNNVPKLVTRFHYKKKKKT